MDEDPFAGRSEERDRARAAALEARAEFERLRDRQTGDGENPGGDGGEPPSESPTSFSDCAVLHENAARAFKVASTLTTMALFDAANEAAALGATLEEAANSCDASAAGEIIEV